jgi:hypothetical protein
MLTTIPWRMMARGCSLGVLAGLLVVAFESSDFQGEICEYNQTPKHKDCTTYSLFPFLLIKVFDTINYYGVAITALATVFIGVFTLTLKLSTDNLWTAAKDQIAAAENAAKMQSRDMQASIAVAQSAADAAKKSAGVAEQALLMVETPYLVPQITECKIRTTANNKYEVDLGNTVTYYINNYGRTPATIYDIYACLLPARGVPAQLDTTGLHTNLTMTEIIPATNRSVDHHFYLNDGLRDSLFGDKTDADQYIIFFVGHIRFGDVFGNEYISGFCLARNGTTGEFYGLGGSKYNYRRKIKNAGE